MKSQILTFSLHHIPLNLSNSSKLNELNSLADVYMSLCQDYVRHFCEEGNPDKFAKPVFPSILSERWQRVAIMQAAGIAKSWLTNRNSSYNKYLRKKAWFEAKYPSEDERNKYSQQAPKWKEFSLPELKKTSIQANQNVAWLNKEEDVPLKIEISRGQGFDFWLRVSTLVRAKTIWLPIKLSEYHRKRLSRHKPNTSIKLERSLDGSWWLSLAFEEEISQQESQEDPIAIDVGINNFITSSKGEHFGSFQEGLKARFERDRAKRQRKAKLRHILEKKGIEKLPSTKSATAERLQRHVIQNINKAIKDYFSEHPKNPVVLEDLEVSAMRFKSKRMNAQLRASNLGHIPNQIKWTAAKLGLQVILVNPAYSSQECPNCHHVHRDNRSSQETFSCQVCGYQNNADITAAENLLSRWNDDDIANCSDIDTIKALLLQRHEAWRSKNAYS